jgi:hypothetical protein
MSVVEPGGSGDVPQVPDGLYKARIAAVKDVTLDEPDRFGNQEKVEITLEFDIEGEVVSLDPRVNRKWGEKATLFAIAQACGLDPDPWAAFDTDALKGKQVNILVEQPDETKWPRVKAWSKVRTNGTKPAQAAPVAQQTHSLINDLGEVDLPAFWAACFAAGLKRQEVVEAVGGDVENLTKMEPTELVAMYEILAAGKSDTPFEG